MPTKKHLELTLEMQAKLDGIDKTINGLERTNRKTKKSNTALGKLKERFIGADSAGGKFASSMGIAGGAIGAVVATAAALVAALVAITAGLIALARRGNEMTDNQAKQAAALGLTIDELTQYQLAAEFSGVSTEKMDKAILNFNKKLGEAAQRGGETAKTFERLGLNAEELAKKSPAEAFELFGAALDKVEGQSNKTAIAQEVLGREGIKVAKVFENNSAAVQQAKDIYDEYNLGLSDIELSKVEQTNDKFTKAGKIFDRLKQKLGVELAPLFNFIAELAFKALKQIAQWQPHFKTVGKVLGFIIGMLENVARGIKIQINIVRIWGETFTQLFFSAALGAIKMARNIENGVKTISFNLRTFIAKAMDKTINTAIDGLNKLIKKANEIARLNINQVATVDFQGGVGAAPTLEQAGPLEQALEQSQAQAVDKIKELGTEILDNGKKIFENLKGNNKFEESASAFNDSFENTEAPAAATDTEGAITDDSLSKKLTDARAAFDKLKNDINAESLTEIEKLQADFDAKKELILANEAATAAEKHALIEELELQHKGKLKGLDDKSRSDMIKGVAAGLASIENIQGFNSKKAKKAQRAAAIARRALLLFELATSAKANAGQAFSKTMASLPPPINIPAAFGAAGLVIAQAAGAAAQVTSQPLPAFNRGGLVGAGLPPSNSDNRLALVGDGEFITRASVTQRFEPALSLLNQGASPSVVADKLTEGAQENSQEPMTPIIVNSDDAMIDRLEQSGRLDDIVNNVIARSSSQHGI